jgi:hypothetical protein
LPAPAIPLSASGAQREADEDGGEPRRWRAYLTVGEEEEPEEVVYCPTCAKQEFEGDDD